jgi:uncharacterized protein
LGPEALACDADLEDVPALPGRPSNPGCKAGAVAILLPGRASGVEKIRRRSSQVIREETTGSRGGKMANRVGWFEVVGQDGEKLRSFYGDVFGWKFNVPSPEMNYGMTDDSQTGIGGGIGQAQGGPGHATFYVGVPDPQASLDKIEGAGGKTVVPVTEMEMVTFAMFTDPEGHLVGLYKSDES